MSNSDPKRPQSSSVGIRGPGFSKALSKSSEHAPGCTNVASYVHRLGSPKSTISSFGPQVKRTLRLRSGPPGQYWPPSKSPTPGASHPFHLPMEVESCFAVEKKHTSYLYSANFFVMHRESKPEYASKSSPSVFCAFFSSSLIFSRLSSTFFFAALWASVARSTTADKGPPEAAFPKSFLHGQATVSRKRCQTRPRTLPPCSSSSSSSAPPSSSSDGVPVDLSSRSSPTSRSSPSSSAASSAGAGASSEPLSPKASLAPSIHFVYSEMTLPSAGASPLPVSVAEGGAPSVPAAAAASPAPSIHFAYSETTGPPSEAEPPAPASVPASATATSLALPTSPAVPAEDPTGDSSPAAAEASAAFRRSVSSLSAWRAASNSAAASFSLASKEGSSRRSCSRASAAFRCAERAASTSTRRCLRPLRKSASFR
mmetsp:Transcript_19485/g.41516  ORF Transcript_19485/g.41516 Transcript_19485/m.41516 type:complete len:427 (-) Transcript_19485:432-1712(-)